MDRIKSLRSPSTNIAIIQQNILLKYKDLFAFVLERHVEASSEIRSVYVNTVGSYYMVAFDRYVKGLYKLQVRP